MKQVMQISGGTGGGGDVTQAELDAVTDEQFIVAAASADLTAERVATDTATVSWDFGTAAQAKANVVQAGIDHGSIGGLADDDHTQYALLAGRATGQTLTGGTAANDDLTLRPTSNATKGDVFIADTGGNVIIGGGATASELRLLEASGSGTNYTAIKCQAQAADVTYTLPADDGDADQVLSTNGSGTLDWVDQTGGAGGMQELIFTAMANVPPIANFATLDMRNNHPVLDFDAATDEFAVFGAVLPSTYAGGGLSVDIHWTATSATSGDVVWSAEFERMNTDLDADSFASAKTVTGVANATSGIITKTTISFTDGAEMDSLAAGEAFRLRISRDANASDSDDLVGDTELHRVVVRET